MKRKDIITRLPLIDFLNSKLSEIKRANPKILSNKSNVLVALFSELEDKALVPVNNSNTHNYPMGVPITIASKHINCVKKSSFTLTSTSILDFSFVGLIPNGNHIIAQDLEIVFSTNISEYINGLHFLKEIIDIEIEYWGSEEEEEIPELLNAFQDILLSPTSTKSMIFLKKAIERVITAVKTSDSKRGRVQRLKNINVFPSIA